MRQTYQAPSGEHFAATGKRVASANDPADHGVVLKWVSPVSFVVRWDNGMETICTTFDVEVG